MCIWAFVGWLRHSLKSKLWLVLCQCWNAIHMVMVGRETKGWGVECICFSGKRSSRTADFNANSFPEPRLSDAYCMEI